MDRNLLTGRTRLTAYVVMALYSGALLAYGLTLPGAFTRVLGALPLFVTGGFWLFDNWLWRSKWILPFIRQPLLDGTWHGELRSYRRDERD